MTTKKTIFRHGASVVLLLVTIVTGAVAQGKNDDEGFGSLRKKLGVKAGANFLSLPQLKTADQSLSGNAGFFVGGYFSLPAKRIGYRSEIIFSRQGYDYKTGTKTGDVKLDYIVLPQLMTLNITRFLQLQAGGQVSFLLNATVDSSGSSSPQPYIIAAKNYYNKLNYGFAGGLEVKPLAGLLVGGRYNLFFNLLREAQVSPAYTPDYSGNLKNGLIQFYIGYEF